MQIDVNEVVKILLPAVVYLVASLFYLLGYKLRENPQKKNIIIQLIESLMIQAENLFKTGSERKKWVIEQIQSQLTKLGVKLSDSEIDGYIESFMSVANSINKRGTPSSTKVK